MPKTVGFIITAGHMDIEWYQPMVSYRYWTVEALGDLKTAAKRDDFHTYVLDGQVYPLEEYLEVLPHEAEMMRELVKSGKLTIGPFYTQFDEWIPSAENMIRNCLYGKRKALSYGGYMRAGYLPDNFGHPRQMPQILQGFGIDSLMFMRGLPEIPGGHPDEFIYRGIDGTEVLVSHFRDSYSSAFNIFGKRVDPIQPRIVPYYDEYLSYEYYRELADHDDLEGIAKSMVDTVHRVKERYPSGVIALMTGYDHMPPQISIGEAVRIANEMQDEIDFIMGTAEDYIKLARERITEAPTVYEMELIGSRYQNILFGALSTRSYLKRENFACEALLEHYAEPLDAIASLYGAPDKPALFDEAWKNMLLNSAHDSIHGSSTDEVHVEMQARFMRTHQLAAGIIHDAMAYLGKHTKRWWEKSDDIRRRGFLTYAPITTAFDQPSELWLPIGDSDACVYDSDGNLLPTQILPREEFPTNSLGQKRTEYYPDKLFRKVLFMHPNADGAIRSYAIECGKTSEFAPIDASDTHIENEFLRVEVEGSCIHLTDKRSGKTYCNLNLLEEEADAGDAWDFSPTWLPNEIVRSSSFGFTSQLIEQGAVRAVIEIKGEMSVPTKLCGDKRSHDHVPMPVTFKVTLWRGLARADVSCEIDNTARDHRIRLRIPSSLKTDYVRSQSHLAILDRPIERPKMTEKWYQPQTQLLPFREWLSVNDGTNGIAVAFKGMYDYEAIENPLSGEPDVCVTLVRGVEMMGRVNIMQRRGSASPAVHTPEAQCLGKQVMEWSFIPYTVCEEDKAPFLPLAHSFLYPTVSHAIRSVPISEDHTSIPAAFSHMAENIVFSAFKKCCDRDGYILRLYENQGKAVTVSVNVGGFTKAWLANMDEAAIEPLEIINGCVTLAFAPYKAITIKLQ